MSENQILVAELCGDELRVSRYHLRLASSSRYPGAEPHLSAVLRRLKPHVLLWDPGDPRGRESGRSFSAGRWLALPSDHPGPECAGLEVPRGEMASLSQLLRGLAGAVAAGEHQCLPGPEKAEPGECVDEHGRSRSVEVETEDESVGLSVSAPAAPNPAMETPDAECPTSAEAGADAYETTRQLARLLAARARRACEESRNAQPGAARLAG